MKRGLSIHRLTDFKHVNLFTSIHTFFPIPLVGDGAGDTGTKSIRFGDEEADFSKSLSL